MPQVPRDDKQEQLFRLALPGMSTLYSHPKTRVMKITKMPPNYPAGFDFSGGAYRADGQITPNKVQQRGSNSRRREASMCLPLTRVSSTLPRLSPMQATYEGRGWCYEESCISNLVKDSTLVLDLGLFSGTKTKLWDVAMECNAGREPPHSPQEFNLIVEKKSFTNKAADLETVKSLYAAAFELRIGQAKMLIFKGLGWGDAEAAVLSKALHAAKDLVELDLDRNPAIGDEGAAALAAALREGAAPKLREIALRYNEQLSEAAKQALREAREGLDVC